MVGDEQGPRDLCVVLMFVRVLSVIWRDSCFGCTCGVCVRFCTRICMVLASN